MTKELACSASLPMAENSARSRSRRYAGPYSIRGVSFTIINQGPCLMAASTLKNFSWERMIAAVEDVRERACRATAALKQAEIAHVVIGGNAVAAWVARVDKEAVRNTKDVDLLIRQENLL